MAMKLWCVCVCVQILCQSSSLVANALTKYLDICTSMNNCTITSNLSWSDSSINHSVSTQIHIILHAEVKKKQETMHLIWWYYIKWVKLFSQSDGMGNFQSFHKAGRVHNRVSFVYVQVKHFVRQQIRQWLKRARVQIKCIVSKTNVAACAQIKLHYWNISKMFRFVRENWWYDIRERQYECCEWWVCELAFAMDLSINRLEMWCLCILSWYSYFHFIIIIVVINLSWHETMKHMRRWWFLNASALAFASSGCRKFRVHSYRWL